MHDGQSLGHGSIFEKIQLIHRIYWNSMVNFSGLASEPETETPQNHSTAKSQSFNGKAHYFYGHFPVHYVSHY